MKGRAIRYSGEEMAWLEERQDWPRATLHSVFVVLFERRDVAADALKALCQRRGWKTGRDGCFTRGQAPANKGKLCPPGIGGRHPNSRATQFKPGARSGRAKELHKPIGAERLSKEGYLERKIHDGLPMQSRWRAAHLIEWEAANGPIPVGHCLKCISDRADTAPSNWRLIPRAILPRLNGGRHKRHLAVDDASPEVRPTLIVMAQVAHRARRSRAEASR